MRHFVIGLMLVLVVQVAGLRTVAAALDPHALSVPEKAFPAGAFVTHEHVDRTAAQVDAEAFVGTHSTQGEFYQHLRFSGSLFESARLPSFHGVTRELWLLATVFPSASVAQQALSADARFNQCDLSPELALPGRAITCAYEDTRGPESGMYVVSAVGPVEFIVLGFVHSSSDAARARASRDAAFLAIHEAARIKRVISG